MLQPRLTTITTRLDPADLLEEGKRKPNPTFRDVDVA